MDAFLKRTFGKWYIGRKIMSDHLPISVAQSFIASDVSQNGLHICETMAQAKNDGARLIHFPEGALSGYVKAQIHSWDKVHWDQLKTELIKVMEAAGRLGIWVVVGCNHRLTHPNRPHNSLFVISDTGELVTRYDKRFALILRLLAGIRRVSIHVCSQLMASSSDAHCASKFSSQKYSANTNN